MMYKCAEEKLMDLLQFGSVKMIREFVMKNLSLNLHHPAVSLKTPLTIAIDRGDPQILSILIEKIPTNLDDTSTQPWGRTVLMYAAYVSRQSAMLQILLKKDANPCKTDIRGWTCLQHAIVGNRVDNVSFLLDYGLFPDVRDTEGKTSLMISVIYADIDILQLLLDRGVDINACDKMGFSALHLAVIHRKRDAALLLMETGCDIQMPTPLSGVSIRELSETTMPNLLPCIQIGPKPLVPSNDICGL